MTPPREPPPSPPRRNPLLLLLLFAVAFVPRWLYRNGGLFHVDEVLLAEAVEESARRHALAGAVCGRYGSVLLNLAAYLPWHAATGENAEKTVLFTAILSGALVVVMAYLLFLETCRDRRAALLAALFLCFNDLFLVTTTTGKEHVHLLLFLLLSMYLVVVGARLDRFRWKLCGILSYAFALTVHEAALPFLPVILLLLVGSERLHRPLRPWRVLAETGALLLAAALPMAAYLYRVVLGALANAGAGVEGHGGYFGGLSSEYLLLSLSKLRKIVGWPFLALAVPGLATCRKEPWFPVLYAPWLLSFLYFGNMVTMTERYLIFPMVPFVALPALAVSRLAGRAADRRIRAALLACAVAAVCGYGAARALPLLARRAAYCGPKEMSTWVGKHTEDNAVILAMDEAPFYRYYARRRTATRPPNAGPEANRAFVEEIRRLVVGGTPVYMTLLSLTYDRDRTFSVLLDNAFRYRYVGSVADEAYIRNITDGAGGTNHLYRLVLPPPRPGGG